MNGYSQFMEYENTHENPQDIKGRIWPPRKDRLIENAKVFFLFRVFSARYWELKQYSIVIKTKPSTDDVYGKKMEKIMGLSENRVYSQWNSHLKTG